MSDSGEKPRIITGDDWKKRPEPEQASQGEPSPTSGDAGEQKLSSDADWKAQARAEKERLARREAEAKGEGAGEGEGGQGEAGGGREMPPANFQTLLSTIASQALLYMGAIPDPMTGQRIAHLELARHHIDLLGVLEEKTKGNLDDDEQTMISQTVRELRMYFTQVSEQLAKQQASQGQQQPGGGGQNPLGGMGGPGGANPFGGPAGGGPVG